MSDHSRLVPGDYLDDPEVRAGYEETWRAIELGAVVRQLRFDAGLSQEELAQRAGMTQPALSRLERGGTVPTLAVLDRIASALQATLTMWFWVTSSGGTSRGTTERLGRNSSPDPAARMVCRAPANHDCA